jgi:hypothetical protein
LNKLKEENDLTSDDDKIEHSNVNIYFPEKTVLNEQRACAHRKNPILKTFAISVFIIFVKIRNPV